MLKLDSYAFKPFYYQLAEHLDRKIASGELKPETRLPTEDELCRQYNVSRNTLRSCLKKLEGEGKIHRVKGRGTFVASNVPRVKNLVVLISGNPGEHPPVQGLLAGVLMCAQAEDVVIQVVTQNRYAGLLETARRNETRQTGVLLLRRSPLNRENAELAAKNGFPVLVEGCSGLVGCSTINIDNEDAIRKSVAHLYGLGHRAFGFVGLRDDDETGHCRQRAEAFKTALAERGLALPLRGTILCRERDMKPDLRARDARERMVKLLDRPDRPTALVAASDSVAEYVYRVAGALGLRIPADLSVVGFDDMAFAAHLTPPLTTIRQDYCQLGFLAAQHVLHMMAKFQNRSFHIKHELDLIVRNSTASPGTTCPGSHP